MPLQEMKSMRTDTEEKELQEAYRVINTLNITQFLTKIKERVAQWKKELTHGS